MRRTDQRFSQQHLAALEIPSLSSSAKYGTTIMSSKLVVNIESEHRIKYETSGVVASKPVQQGYF